jgi:hypothetical protein
VETFSLKPRDASRGAEHKMIKGPMSTDRRNRKRVIVYRAELPDSNELWEVEYDAVADALHFACRDFRERRRKPIEILEDGVQVHDADSIAAACEERANEVSGND